jgi:hypothetical protein
LRRLSNAFIDILESQYGTEPRQIVDFAKDRFRNRAREFDRVFVVFDRDDHRSYHDALLTCQRAKLRNDASKPVELCAVASNPCFELWLLLHFEDVFELFHRREILGKLKRQMPDYEKALRGAFERTQTHLAAATARAERLQARFKPEADTEGPYTNVDVVVDLLLKMRGPD